MTVYTSLKAVEKVEQTSTGVVELMLDQSARKSKGQDKSYAALNSAKVNSRWHSQKSDEKVAKI